MPALLTPPIAFVIYLLAGGLLLGFGRVLAGPGRATAAKSATYASGEAPPSGLAAQGYSRSFFMTLFFGVLHLGVLVLATSTLPPVAGVFIVGLLLALLVLWLE